VIHTCPACGQKNRVPVKYTGIPVCARCKTQMFETQMRAKADPKPGEERLYRPTSSVPQKRSRWSWRDRWLAIPILMLAVPIYAAFNHDWTWLFDRTIDWVTTISVNVVLVSAIALAWLIVALALKVSWEEVWLTMQQRRHRPPEEDENLLDIGPWEALQDYITLARQKFAMRKERQHATH